MESSSSCIFSVLSFWEAVKIEDRRLSEYLNTTLRLMPYALNATDFRGTDGTFEVWLTCNMLLISVLMLKNPFSYYR